MNRLILVMALVAVACSSPLDVDESELPLTRTVGDSFELRPAERPDRLMLQVPFYFTNKTERPLSLVHCHNDVPRLERATADGWVRVFSGPELLCLQVRTFAPRETIADTAHFFWSTNPEADNGFRPGEYRLAWDNLWADYRDYDAETDTWGTPVDGALLVSNPFMVQGNGS